MLLTVSPYLPLLLPIDIHITEGALLILRVVKMCLKYYALITNSQKMFVYCDVFQRIYGQTGLSDDGVSRHSNASE